MHHRNAAYINPQTEPEAPIFQSPNRLKSFDDGHIGVDKLKIDQSFVRRLDCLKSEPSHETIQKMIEVGRTMDLVVTAEGVETDEQRRFLASAGCDALQGYLFARPMAARDLDAFLNRARVPAAA
jgi:EAL domain-containing protein (putative c-di-GMP-specific phosphodiesterase class I)